MRKLYLLILAAAVTACASEAPQKVATATPPAAPVQVAAPAAVAPSAPASAVDAAATPAQSGGFVAPAGYQKKTRGTTTVYCKSDTPVGTRFAKEYCYTQSDLERMEASRTNTKQEIERVRRTCSGGGCGGG